MTASSLVPFWQERAASFCPSNSELRPLEIECVCISEMLSRHRTVEEQPQLESVPPPFEGDVDTSRHDEGRRRFSYPAGFEGGSGKGECLAEVCQACQTPMRMHAHMQGRRGASGRSPEESHQRRNPARVFPSPFFVPRGAKNFPLVNGEAVTSL